MGPEPWSWFVCVVPETTVPETELRPERVDPVFLVPETFVLCPEHWVLLVPETCGFCPVLGIAP